MTPLFITLPNGDLVDARHVLAIKTYQPVAVLKGETMICSVEVWMDTEQGISIPCMEEQIALQMRDAIIQDIRSAIQKEQAAIERGGPLWKESFQKRLDQIDSRLDQLELHLS